MVRQKNPLKFRGHERVPFFVLRPFRTGHGTVKTAVVWPAGGEHRKFPAVSTVSLFVVAMSLHCSCAYRSTRTSTGTRARWKSQIHQLRRRGESCREDVDVRVQSLVRREIYTSIHRGEDAAVQCCTRRHQESFITYNHSSAGLIH